MYHLSIKIITRSAGRSAVAAAAYRAGDIIKNERDGIIHDYTRKSDVMHTEILLPHNAPPEYKNRALLWNAVEQVEKASNSQLAREIQIALPVELTLAQNKSLVREYVKENFTDHGMIADVALHASKDGKNPHAHIMLTMRPFNEDRTWGSKTAKRICTEPTGRKNLRPQKETVQMQIHTRHRLERKNQSRGLESVMGRNRKHLAQLNHDKRLDHRSYKRQGKNQIPTIHLGVAAHQMEKRGILTDRGNINRAIEISNRKLRQLEERINELQGWLAEEMAKPETPPAKSQTAPPQPPKPQQPTFADVIADILSRQGQIIANATA